MRLNFSSHIKIKHLESIFANIIRKEFIEEIIVVPVVMIADSARFTSSNRQPFHLQLMQERSVCTARRAKPVSSNRHLTIVLHNDKYPWDLHSVSPTNSAAERNSLWNRNRCQMTLGDSENNKRMTKCIFIGKVLSVPRN